MEATENSNHSQKKKSSLKKWFYIMIAGFVILITSLAIIPVFFKDTVNEKLGKLIEKKLNAQVKFSDINLSFFEDFPSLAVAVHDFSLKPNLQTKTSINKDTLFVAKKIWVSASVLSFLDKDKPMVLEGLGIDRGKIYLETNLDGIANYERLFKQYTSQNSKGNSNEDIENSSPVSLHIDHYKIIDTEITFHNSASKQRYHLSGLNHKGKLKFQDDELYLDTHTDAFLDWKDDIVTHFKNQSIDLDAEMHYDFKQSKLVLDENKFYFNTLPFVLDGSMVFGQDPNHTSMEVDMHLQALESEFKDLFHVLPKEYTAFLEDYKSQGKFQLKGDIKGVLDDQKIPKLHIELLCKQASLTYLPDNIHLSNIHLTTLLKNQTGDPHDTSVYLKDGSFQIGQEKILVSAKVEDLSHQMKTDFNIKGGMQMSELQSLLPHVDWKSLGLMKKGSFTTDLQTKFNLAELQQRNYNRLNLSGKLDIKELEYVDPTYLSHPLLIDRTIIVAKDDTLSTPVSRLKTGKTTLVINGKTTKKIQELLNDELYQFSMKLKSDLVYTSDLMPPTTVTKEYTNTIVVNDSNKNQSEPFKFPKNIVLRADASIKNLHHQTDHIKNFTGGIKLKDQKVLLDHLQGNALGGSFDIAGEIHTRDQQPFFRGAMGIKEVPISELINRFDYKKPLDKIGKTIEGKLTTILGIAGKLTPSADELDISTTSGNLKNTFSNLSISSSKNSFMSRFGEAFEGVNQLFSQDLLKNTEVGLLARLLGNDYHFKTLQNKIYIDKGGKFRLNPFVMDIDKFKVRIQGDYSLSSEQMDIKLDVSGLLFDLEFLIHDQTTNIIQESILYQKKDEILNLPVVLPIHISGTIDNPSFKMDKDAMVANLKNTVINDRFIKGTKKSIVNFIKDKSSGKLIQDIRSKIDNALSKNKDTTSLSLSRLTKSVFQKKINITDSVQTPTTTPEKKDNMKFVKGLLKSISNSK